VAGYFISLECVHCCKVQDYYYSHIVVTKFDYCCGENTQLRVKSFREKSSYVSVDVDWCVIIVEEE
jgi:hypothetical protein